MGSHYRSLLNTCKSTGVPSPFKKCFQSYFDKKKKKKIVLPILSFEEKYKHFPLKYIGPLQPKIRFKVVKNWNCLNFAVLINDFTVTDIFSLQISFTTVNGTQDYQEILLKVLSFSFVSENHQKSRFYRKFSNELN